MIANEETRAQATGAPPLSAIAKLNDDFRRSGNGGKLAVTAGVIALGRQAFPDIFERVRVFDAFTGANDPYGEHDFGALEWRGELIFWKIDYYDADMQGGSPEPADSSVTTRVLTIMLATEY